jgi:hypothetical protein
LTDNNPNLPDNNQRPGTTVADIAMFVAGLLVGLIAFPFVALLLAGAIGSLTGSPLGVLLAVIFLIGGVIFLVTRFMWERSIRPFGIGILIGAALITILVGACSMSFSGYQG